jgi:hypothetical protein
MRLMGGHMFIVAGILVGVASAVGSIGVIGASPVAPGNPWQAWQISPNSRAQPYAMAHYLLEGRFPPATGQMQEFTAQRSSDGGVLVAACTYVLVAQRAPTQWWSMAAISGSAVGLSVNFVQSSETAVAEPDGSLRIVVARLPQPGNWLQAPQAGAFGLLYTVADSSAGLHPERPPAFTIERRGC